MSQPTPATIGKVLVSELDVPYPRWDGKPPTALNTVDIYTPGRALAVDREMRSGVAQDIVDEIGDREGHGVWVIYIHGGAWRDPAVTSKSFLPTLSVLAQRYQEINAQLGGGGEGGSEAQQQQIRAPWPDQISGFASMNYRLSPYPDHPTKPTHPTGSAHDGIPPASRNDESRDAIHPDHLHDVLAALNYLQRRFGFEERYILVGHSCGATLAWQVVLAAAQEMTLPRPLGVVAFAGVHSLPVLLANHPPSHTPVYEQIIVNAFGPEWLANCALTSPVEMLTDMHKRGQRLRDRWPEGRLAMMVQSKDDELVDGDQVLMMGEALRMDAERERELPKRRDEVVWVEGWTHDEIWEKGDAVAETVMRALDVVNDAKRNS